eukprot:1139599-Pelagomonas_calceolata.AAC.1
MKVAKSTGRSMTLLGRIQTIWRQPTATCLMRQLSIACCRKAGVFIQIWVSNISFTLSTFKLPLPAP